MKEIKTRNSNRKLYMRKWDSKRNNKQDRRKKQSTLYGDSKSQGARHLLNIFLLSLLYALKQVNNGRPFKYKKKRKTTTAVTKYKRH